MLSFRLFVIAFCAFLFILSHQNVFAGDSGVIKLELPDAAAVGMGTAFTGEADRPSAVYYNPAGITQIGTEMSAGLTVLQPQMEYKSPTGNTVEMNRDYYIFPHVYVTTPVIKEKFYVGLGENSSFGSGNDWAANSLSTFTRYSTVKDSFVNKDYMLEGAYKLNEQWSFGVGVVNDDSKIEKDKALNQYDGNDGDALFKATDDAWGFNLATLFKLNSQNQFGLTYKSPIHHTYEGNLYLSNLDNNVPIFGAGGYQYAFGGTSFSTKAIQKFTLPQSVTLGYSFKPTSKWKINFDLEWTDWSNTKRETTSFPDLSGPLAGLQSNILSTNNPQSRDWTSVWSESLGAEYALTDKFRIRGGYAHHQTPVPEGTFDTSFPDSNYNAYSTGFGFDLTKNLTIDVTYSAVFYESRNVVNTVDQAFGANLSGKYKEFVNIGTATLTYKF
ncbi:MAG: outer membrane protein transport protein [Candidatus Omnitrophica bacterium]|nr:outer membrane protein transport protein [Candidatus Omnitrophota bacterium]